MDIGAILLDLIEACDDAIARGYDTDIWWWSARVNEACLDYKLVRAEVKWLVKRVNRYIQRIEGKDCHKLLITEG